MSSALERPKQAVQYATQQFVRETIAREFDRVLKDLVTQTRLDVAISGVGTRILREFPRLIAKSVAEELEEIGFPLDVSEAIKTRIVDRVRSDLAPSIEANRTEYRSLKAKL